MPSSHAMQVELTPEIEDRLTEVATRLDRPKSWVIEQALKDFLEFQSWQIAAIEKGVRDADAGRLVAHEEVVAWVESWERPDEKPMPECK